MGIFIGVVAAFSLGIVGHGGSTTTEQIVQRFICERSYTNFATGYQHSGIYVDRDGGVYRFDVQIPGYPRLPQGPDLTEAEMENQYGAERKLLRTVAAGELQAMFQLIPGAAKGQLSKKVSAGADRGAWVSSCYLFDSAGKRYREVELDVVGDWTYRNLAPEAQRLAAWLTTLERLSHDRREKETSQ